ncbi:sulfatase [Niabella insulamsoli]|uniref:sulfatase n=1 Tax=Niabella insulamsoli TaxID=3144874 RepID=UPI0031FDCCEF
MNRKLLLLSALVVAVNIVSVHAQKTKPNVLFIFIDDLRPDLGCYGNKEVKTPNMDALAASGVVFNQQFVAVPTCGASRASILTGLYPRVKSDVTNDAIEKSLSGKPAGVQPESFVEQFKRSGYYTVGIGKISHSADGYLYAYDAPRSNQLEKPHSWNEMLFDAGKWGTGWNAFFGYADGSSRTSKQRLVKPYEAGNCDDAGYPDGLTAGLAEKKMKDLARLNKPFLMAVGFFKPHLPFNAPAKYWDLYDEDKLSTAPWPKIPEGINKASLHSSAEFKSYQLGEEQPSLEKPVSEQYARKLRHAYYAALSYTDAQVGRVMKSLKENGLDKNTIVVLWGDHGWHLGDDLVWGKHTLFDWALRSAFIIKTPSMKKAITCDNIVSSTDVYPTLMELCGLQTKARLDGRSLVPLLTQTSKSGHKDVALSYFNKGISIRTSKYRFTQYFRSQKPTIELYDHSSDPLETKNVAHLHPGLVQKMMTTWKDKIDQASKMYAN